MKPVLILLTCALLVIVVYAATEGVKYNCADGLDCKYCVYGWYGQYCDLQCPTHCDSGCHRTNGHCDHACVLTYWGRFCEHTCPPHCMEGCNQTAGSCHGGCSPGWYNAFCNNSCRGDCAICVQSDGECLKFKSDGDPRCKEIWTGRGLVKNCSVGCESGWSGAECNQRCPEECQSCSRFPDGQECIYKRKNITYFNYRFTDIVSDEFGSHVGFTILFVISPFVAIGILCIRCICRNRKTNACESETKEG